MIGSIDHTTSNSPHFFISRKISPKKEILFRFSITNIKFQIKNDMSFLQYFSLFKKHTKQNTKINLELSKIK